MSKRKGHHSQKKRGTGSKNVKPERISGSEYVQTSSTPYDDTFRTLMTKGGNLRIPFINEMFRLEEPILPGTRIENVVNEYFIDKGDGKQKEIITDTVLHIGGKTFHVECQSTADGSILIRIVEYDVNIGINESQYQDFHLDIHIPVSGVLYLRSTSTTPDQMTVSFHTPGGSVDYTVAVMRLKDYSLAELFEKNLLFLLPFYLFNLEKEFKDYEKGSEEARHEVVTSVNVLLDQLNHLQEEKKITSVEYMMITDLFRKVTDHLTAKYDNVRKEFDNIMSGRVLKFKWEKPYYEGKAEGKAEGQAQERAKADKEQEERARNMIQDGLTDSKVEAYSGVSLKRIREIRLEEEKKARA